LRIVVIADTHGPPMRLPARLIEIVAECDLLIHAGDFCTREMLSTLQRLAPVAAVWGNNDEDEIRSRLPERLALKIGSCQVEVIHGHQNRTAMATAQTVAKTMTGPGVVIFGHSHQAWCCPAGDILLLNPGSPTAARFSRRKTYAVLTTSPDLRADIIDLV